VNLVFILVVFTKVPVIQGWNREEVLFIYGFFLLPFGIYSGFFNHLLDVPEKYVIQGAFDRVLLRPLNTWFQVVMETMKPELLADILAGLLIMVYAGGEIGLSLTWWDLPLALGLVMAAALIYAGVYTALASLGFWTDGNIGLMPMIYNLSQYGRFPVTIYRGLVRFILTWVLPFAFVGFYPATLLLRRTEFYRYAVLTPLVGVACFTVAYQVWRAGVRRYNGAGS
jgi:ABC-2 type transport system permease protein